MDWAYRILAQDHRDNLTAQAHPAFLLAQVGLQYTGQRRPADLQLPRKQAVKVAIYRRIQVINTQQHKLADGDTAQQARFTVLKIP